MRRRKEFHSVQNRKFKPLQWVSFTGLLVALCLVFYVFNKESERGYSSASKTLRFNYVLKNTSGEFIPHADFSIKIPMSIDAIQSVISINSSHKNELLKEKDGEQSIGFPIENISPYSSKMIDLTLMVNISDKPKYERINSDNYLMAEKYIELDSPSIKLLAAQLKGSSSKETAKNIYEWLVNNVTSLSYTADNKGAQYLIEKRSGDCTELMYAFVALARANGIPARGVNGFWVSGDSTIINAADYHDWAEFYDGDGWVIVDPQKQNFNSNNMSYLSLTNLTGVSQKYKRFVVSDNSVSVAFQ